MCSASSFTSFRSVRKPISNQHSRGSLSLAREDSLSLLGHSSSDKVHDWQRSRFAMAFPRRSARRRPHKKAEQSRADAADGLTFKRSFTKGSNMNDETKPADPWERTKAWADKNRTISGALVGGAAGTILPGIGTMIGAIVGAGIGFASSKEKPLSRIRSSVASRLRATRRSRTSSSSPKSNRRSAARDDRVN